MDDQKFELLTNETDLAVHNMAKKILSTLRGEIQRLMDETIKNNDLSPLQLEQLNDVIADFDIEAVWLGPS